MKLLPVECQLQWNKVRTVYELYLRIVFYVMLMFVGGPVVIGRRDKNVDSGESGPTYL